MKILCLILMGLALYCGIHELLNFESFLGKSTKSYILTASYLSSNPTIPQEKEVTPSIFLPV